MTTQGKFALCVGLLLMGLTAAVLGRMQAFQKLGQPGLRLVAQNVYAEGGSVIGTNAISLPEKVLNFESKDMPISTNVVTWLPPDTTYSQRAYQDPDGFQALMNVVLMGTDRTSIHKPEYCLPAQGFAVQKSERRMISIQKPHPYDLPVVKMTTAKEMIMANGQKTQVSGLYVYWFVADQQITADHAERMRWMARDLITKGVLQRWAYVSCFAVCLPGQEDAAYARMEKLIAAAVPEFQLATGAMTVATRGSADGN